MILYTIVIILLVIIITIPTSIIHESGRGVRLGVLHGEEVDGDHLQQLVGGEAERGEVRHEVGLNLLAQGLGTRQIWEQKRQK